VNGSILYGIGALIVVIALGIWIGFIVRRAARINRASNSRLNSDLSQLAVNPVHAPAAASPGRATASVPGEPIMFSDDLPTEVTEIATAALAGEKDETPAPEVETEASPAAEPAVAEQVVAEPAVVEPADSSTSEVEMKLAKLKDLHARGVITDEEHAAARLNALSE
jgi:cytoskeletal protein RodZ